jgi:hypothetical protein
MLFEPELSRSLIDYHINHIYRDVPVKMKMYQKIMLISKNSYREYLKILCERNDMSIEPVS